MKKIRMVAIGIAMMMAGMLAVSAPAMAAVDCPDGTYRKINDIPADNIAQCNLPADSDTPTTGGLWNTVQTIINWVLAVLGLVTVVMIIIGGFTYLTSQGDPGKTKKGRDTILYGVIGLIIALLAFAIVNFVLTNVFGNN